jgi:hypothetical protein
MTSAKAKNGNQIMSRKTFFKTNETVLKTHFLNFSTSMVADMRMSLAPRELVLMKCLQS